jgi:hypothetical protein
MKRLPPTPIKDSLLYKNECVRLAGRISPRKLLIELNKVHRSGQEMLLLNDPIEELGHPNDMFPLTVEGAFIWAGTPQGVEFWGRLSNDY